MWQSYPTTVRYISWGQDGFSPQIERAGTDRRYDSTTHSPESQWVYWCYLQERIYLHGQYMTVQSTSPKSPPQHESCLTEVPCTIHRQLLWRVTSSSEERLLPAYLQRVASFVLRASCSALSYESPESSVIPPGGNVVILKKQLFHKHNPPTCSVHHDGSGWAVTY